MNALEAFGDHRAHAQQLWPLGRPIARTAAAVLLAGQNHQRHAALGVLLAGVEDRHLLALGQEARNSAFRARSKFVPQPHIGEGAAHHHFMIAAPRAVGIKVPRLDAVRRQIHARRSVGLDRSGWRDMVGRYRVSQNGQHTRPQNVCDWRGSSSDSIKVWSLANISRIRLPLIDLAGGEFQPLPVGVALADGGVLATEALAAHA